MHRIIATAGLMALASAPNAYAETVMLDVAPQAQLQMEVPQGFCPVRATQSDLDKALLAFFERSLHGEAKLLAFFVDCKAYAELGTGSYAPHSWILVLAPLDGSGDAASPPGATRAQVLDAAAKRAAADTAASFTDVAFADAQETGSDTGLDVSSQNRPLGVLERDANAVYQGLLSRVRSNGVAGNVAGLINTTYVAGRLININAYAVYDTPQAFEDLIEFSKAVTKDFVSANEQAAP